MKQILTISFLLLFVSAKSQALLLPGMAVTTEFPDLATDRAVHVFDIRQTSNGNPGNNWSAPELLPQNTTDWTRNRLGGIFGIAIDDEGSFYLAASSVYFYSAASAVYGSAGAGGIYKVRYNDWSVTDFVSTDPSGSTSQNLIPNTGNGLGNLSYDKWHDQLFATNFEDGKIYRIDMNGTILNTFDPFGADNGSAGETSFGELLWGIDAYGTDASSVRLYFARWNCSLGPSQTQNEIWSVSLDANGNFSGTEQLEISLPHYYPPDFYGSSPVSDIRFSSVGRMLVAERSMENVFEYSAHYSRLMEFQPSSSGWNNPAVFHVGNLGWQDNGMYNNSAGGCAYGITGLDSNGDPEGCEQMVWSTGDALKFTGYNPDNTNDYVYGIAGIPASGNSLDQNASDFVCSTSLYVDFNGIIQNDIPKLFLGCVDTRLSCELDYCGIPCQPINVMTPNNDYRNDYFELPCIVTDGWKLEIIDRWGVSLYKNDNYHNEWNAPNAIDGVYYYILQSPCEGEKPQAGFFHVAR
jgi:hypothetical protein